LAQSCDRLGAAIAVLLQLGLELLEQLMVITMLEPNLGRSGAERLDEPISGGVDAILGAHPTTSSPSAWR
jgi:hypothetical protein